MAFLGQGSARRRLEGHASRRRVEFEGWIDGALAEYKKLPAIPDAKGRMPGQKKKVIKYIHLPPLDKERFPVFFNPEPNGLALDPWMAGMRSRRNVMVVDEGAELTLSEQLTQVLRERAARILDLFRQWDTDGDGEVTRDEFVRAFMENRGLMLDVEHVSHARLAELFDEWDVDGSGSITLDELKKILTKRKGSVVPPPPPERKKSVVKRAEARMKRSPKSE